MDRESGDIIEEYLGGVTTMPRKNLKLVQQMLDNGELIPTAFQKDDKYKKSREELPEKLPELLNQAEEYYAINKKRYPAKAKELMDKMHATKKVLGHEFLLAVLLRYNMNAVSNAFRPWDPVPTTGEIGGGKGRRMFASNLRDEIEDKMEAFNLPNYETSKFQYFNSSETPLDNLYSTDAFYVFDGSLFEDGEKRIVLLDITSNPEKGLTRDKNESGSVILYIDASDLHDEDIDGYIDGFSDMIIQRVFETDSSNNVRQIQDATAQKATLATRIDSADRLIGDFESKFDKMAS